MRCIAAQLMRLSLGKRKLCLLNKKCYSQLRQKTLTHLNYIYLFRGTSEASNGISFCFTLTENKREKKTGIVRFLCRRIEQEVMSIVSLVFRANMFRQTYNNTTVVKLHAWGKTSD